MARTRVRDASYRVLDHEPNTGEVPANGGEPIGAVSEPLTRIDMNYPRMVSRPEVRTV